MTEAPYRQLIGILEKCRRVLITTHVRPDGDALGSSAAMVLALRAKGIDAQVLLLNRLPEKYAFVFRDNDIPHQDIESGWPESLDLARFDALVVVDTGTWNQLPGLQERLESWAAPKLIIDHHLTQEAWGDCRIADSSAAAAGEMVAELIRTWGIPFDAALASALYVAIASDTGWFQFANTRPRTLRLAAELMETGLDTDRIYQALYQNERPQRLLLMNRAMQSLELLANSRLAVMRIRTADFTETGAHIPDTENLINVPLQVASVQVSMLISEGPDGRGPVRVSLRSKGEVDVARFAERFGGGGHARASGLKLDLPLDQAHAQVTQAMLPLLAS